MKASGEDVIVTVASLTQEAFMTHRNAPLTPEGRRRMVALVIHHNWTYRMVADAMQVSTATVSKWVRRYRAGASLDDRSSRPHHCPAQTPPAVEQQILDLRTSQQWGPHRIAWQLGMHPSTVHRVLRRHAMPLLMHLDRRTGELVRKPQPVRYEMDTPGALIHVDIKKLGRIPHGGGHREVGRSQGTRNKRAGGPRGYAYLHHAVDSHSRVVYSEILDDERQETAAEFWLRAHAFFAGIGVTVTAVMTDNGSCYRSRTFAEALGPDIRHRRTRPYRPQTNGKVERFNRTLLDEWAYARTYLSDAARSATYPDWLHWYNHHRHHTGIGGLTPAQRVHNLTGKYT